MVERRKTENKKQRERNDFLNVMWTHKRRRNGSHAISMANAIDKMRMLLKENDFAFVSAQSGQTNLQ